MSDRRRFSKAPRAVSERTDANIGLGLTTCIQQARKSGQLNLSNKSLTEVPQAVWRINIDTPEAGKTVSMEAGDDRWWEQIDLNKLILASNALTQLSCDIRLLPALTVLDLHDNRLTSVPDSISELKNLRRLNISHNELDKFPDCITKLSDLHILHLQHNHITQLPNEICNLYSLQELDVSMNRLQSLPTIIDGLSSLTKLNVSQNQLHTLPHQISCILGLRTLDATHNEIHTLPDDLGQLIHLESLYLRHNNLTNLPNLTSCSNLKELHVGNNALTSISSENMRSLTRLSVLDLRDNRISRISDEIILMESLERLDLTNNDLSTLPNAIGTMAHLKTLSLEGNPLKSIRRDIIMRGTNELKKYLRSRVVNTEESGSPDIGCIKPQQSMGIIGDSGVGIDKYKLSSTKLLDYSNKSSSGLSDDVWLAAKEGGVTSVNLSKNAFTQIPSKLLEMEKSLSELDLSANKIQVISSDISRLSRLTMLHIGNNLLQDLPPEMSSLQSLREIVLSYNKFTCIPEALYSLKRLEILLISDCKVCELNVEGLKGLQKLATLDLRNNNISTLSPQLGNCEQLMSLQLEGNPLRQPRAAIISSGTVAILKYLRDRIPA